jgi:hypothetical protein
MPLPFSCDPPLSVMIRSICAPNPPEKLAAAFARACIRLAAASLRMFEAGGYRVRDRRAGGEEDIGILAADCIADLFERDAAGTFVQFRKYFGPSLGRALAEEEWLVLLRRLVTLSAKQGMFRLFRERDPESARLWRNVKRTVRSNRRYKLIETAGREWICERIRERGAAARAGDCIRFISGESEDAGIPADCSSSFLPEDSVPVLIGKTFRAVRSGPGDAPAIGIGDIVRIFKAYRARLGRDAADREGDAAGMEFDRGFDAAAVRVRLEKLGRSLSEKMERDYVQKNKLDASAAEGLRRALLKMLEDLADGGLSSSSFGYVREFLPGLDEGAYRKKLRTIFEYFVKLMKNDVKKIFSKNRPAGTMVLMKQHSQKDS